MEYSNLPFLDRTVSASYTGNNVLTQHYQLLFNILLFSSRGSVDFPDKALQAYSDYISNDNVSDWHYSSLLQTL